MRRAALLLERFDTAAHACALTAPGDREDRHARAEAYSAGFAAGQAAAAGETHGREALLAAAADALAGEFTNAPERITIEAAGALKIILERFFPALSRHGFAAEAAAAFARAIRETGAPSLEIFTASENVEALRGELDRYDATGKITVSADPMVSGSTARARWSAGGVEIDLDRATNECLAALERAVQSIKSESEL